MKKETVRYKLVFTEPLLGSASGNPEIQEEFIASKAETPEKTAEEIAATDVPGAIEKASTIFPRDENGLFVWDYQARGFFKESLGALIELGDVKSISKWLCGRSVDNFLFVDQRRIPLRQIGGDQWKTSQGTLQRALRAKTMQGERVALARSESLPAGTWVEFDVTVLISDNNKAKVACLSHDVVCKCLDYGSMKGFGQWRSGGFGRFNYSIVKPT